jgi:glyoxylase-like metal-dependent hydrolase (beta-lactamase superfamily II)
MKITPFYEDQSGTWTYLLADPESQVAAIIDPVWVYNLVSGTADFSFMDKVLDAAKQEGCRIEWALETHAHADHLTAAGEIRKRTGAGIACGKGICSVQETFARVFNIPEAAINGSQFDLLLGEGDILSVGDLEVRVMETPGHTNDSITYLAGDAAFIGDTLFTPEFGTARCDFPGGDAGQLYDSIQKIYSLPDATQLHLCHDYPKAGEQARYGVSIITSRASNIHIRQGTSKEEFVAMRTARDAQLGLPKLIIPSLQFNIQAGQAPATDSNGVAYLKTPFNRTLADLVRAEAKPR